MLWIAVTVVVFFCVFWLSLLCVLLTWFCLILFARFVAVCCLFMFCVRACWLCCVIVVVCGVAVLVALCVRCFVCLWFACLFVYACVLLGCVFAMCVVVFSLSSCVFLLFERQGSLLCYCLLRFCLLRCRSCCVFVCGVDVAVVV